jgi:hypothetical protein
MNKGNQEFMNHNYEVDNMNKKQDYFYKPEEITLPTPGFKDIPQLHDFWLIDTLITTEAIRLKVLDMESKGAYIISIDSNIDSQYKGWQVIIHYEIKSEVPLV